MRRAQTAFGGSPMRLLGSAAPCALSLAMLPLSSGEARADPFAFLNPQTQVFTTPNAFFGSGDYATSLTAANSTANDISEHGSNSSQNQENITCRIYYLIRKSYK
jgi:hypothetical protein